MLYMRPLLLFLSLGSVFALFLYSAHELHNAQLSDLGEEGAVLPGRKSLALATTSNNSPYILVAERKQRKIPLNSFKIYTGGWNISSELYWAYVGFTAAPIFAITATWIIISGIIVSFAVCCFCCYKNRSYSYSQTNYYTCSLVLLVVFTICTMLGCILLYDGQEKFHEKATNTTNYYLLRQDRDIMSNLRTLSGNLDAEKSSVVDQFSPLDLKLKIDEIVTKVNATTNELDSHTSNNSDKIADVLNTMRATLIVVAAATLLLTSLGFLFSMCGLQTLIYILIIMGWILTAGTLVLCGVSLLVHNIVPEKCVSMDEWVQNPHHDHTALDDVLSCVDPAMATEAMTWCKVATYEIIDTLNGMITNVSNGDFTPQSIPLYYNQSGPLVPELCNPYSNDLSPHTCATEELQFDNAVQVWKGYICEITNVSGSDICTSIGRLTPEFYKQMMVAVNATYGLYHYGIFLSDLVHHNFLRQNFRIHK